MSTEPTNHIGSKSNCATNQITSNPTTSSQNHTAPPTKQHRILLRHHRCQLNQPITSGQNPTVQPTKYHRIQPNNIEFESQSNCAIESDCATNQQHRIQPHRIESYFATNHITSSQNPTAPQPTNHIGSKSNCATNQITSNPTTSSQNHTAPPTKQHRILLRHHRCQLNQPITSGQNPTAQPTK